jgi:hypothetical protein
MAYLWQSLRFSMVAKDALFSGRMPDKDPEFVELNNYYQGGMLVWLLILIIGLIVGFICALR